MVEVSVGDGRRLLVGLKLAVRHCHRSTTGRFIRYGTSLDDIAPDPDCLVMLFKSYFDESYNKDLLCVAGYAFISRNARKLDTEWKKMLAPKRLPIKTEARPLEAADVLAWQWYKDYERRNSGRNKPRGDLRHLMSKVPHYALHADADRLRYMVNRLAEQVSNPLGSQIIGEAIRNPKSAIFKRRRIEQWAGDAFEAFANKVVRLIIIYVLPPPTFSGALPAQRARPAGLGRLVRMGRTQLRITRKQRQGWQACSSQAVKRRPEICNV